MAQKRKIKDRKTVKRKWFPIISPELIGAKKVGDSYTIDYESKVGKTVDINGMFATGNMRQQNINYTLEIISAENQELKTRIKGVNLLNSYVKRIVRKKSSRIDDSFVLKTKDNKFVRIKPILLTRFNIVDSKKRILRLATKQKLLTKGLEITYDELIQSIYKSELQKSLNKELTKICPVKFFEIRQYELLDEYYEKKDEFKQETIKNIITLNDSDKESKKEDESNKKEQKEETTNDLDKSDIKTPKE